MEDCDSKRYNAISFLRSEKSVEVKAAEINLGLTMPTSAYVDPSCTATGFKARMGL